MSAAVDHSISQALTGLLHYIIGEENEDEEAGRGEVVGFGVGGSGRGLGEGVSS